MSPDDGLFLKRDDGVLISRMPMEHREDEFRSCSFSTIREMQHRHFWYIGRRRFVSHFLNKAIRSFDAERRGCLGAIDLGGGCGGWITFLQNHSPWHFSELALADSSIRALEFAGDSVGSAVRRYQIDLLRLPWKERWDVAFLLDVLEHIPNDSEAMQQIHKALRPGGYLFVTTPALKHFWTYNDEMIHHLRRYSRHDFIRLADASGFRLCWSRYFMFLLSPLLMLSRIRAPDLEKMTTEEIQKHQMQTHKVPGWPLNFMLKAVFSLETPLGAWLPFPWGTSVLGVFRKEG